MLATAPQPYQPTRTPVVYETPAYSPPSFATSFMSTHCRPVWSLSLCP